MSGSCFALVSTPRGHPAVRHTTARTDRRVGCKNERADLNAAVTASTSDVAHSLPVKESLSPQPSSARWLISLTVGVCVSTLVHQEAKLTRGRDALRDADVSDFTIEHV